MPVPLYIPFAIVPAAGATKSSLCLFRSLWRSPTEVEIVGKEGEGANPTVSMS